MSRPSRNLTMMTTGISLLIWITTLTALPRAGDEMNRGGGVIPPGMAVDVGELEFTLPLEVAGNAVIHLTNTGGPVLQYQITSKISPGFKARYYSNAAGASPAFGDLVFERQDERINNTWNAGGPQNGLGNDNFGVIWEGIFIAPENARYGFRTNTDDGVRLYIDGNRVINDWINHNATPRNWEGQLSFGPHRLRMEYYEDRNNAVAQLSWQPPGGQMAIMQGQSEAGWITMNPSHGNIAVGSVIDVAIRVETRDFEVGREYRDTIFVNSNDRDLPSVPIPVSLLVTPWQPGEVDLSAPGVARRMQPNAREQSQLTLRSVGRGNYDYRATIEGNDRGWLTVTPSAGSIGPGLESNLTLNFNSTGRNQGIFNVTLVLTGNDDRNPRIEIPVTMAVAVPFGTVFGRVLNRQFDEPIAGALVGVEGMGFIAATDEDGNFELDVPANRHRLWVTAPDYLRYGSDEFEVGDGQRVEVNPMLRQGTFNPILEEVELYLAPEDTLTLPLAVRNRGNGTVTWQGEVVFPDEHQLLPWQQQLRFNISREGIQDNRINGVEFLYGNFYVSGGNEGRGFGKIYVFDEEGGFVRDFDQFLEGTQFGMRDLAWDGELLWGSDNGVVYGFDLEGNLEAQFNGPINPCRALTFDPEGTLWIADSQTDLFRVDREGQVLARIRNPGGRKFGFAWYEHDPDGFPLFMFTSDNEHPIALQKYSPEGNELAFVTDLVGLPADRAGGLAIAGNWDPYSWSLITQMNSNADAIVVYNLASRTDWIDLLADEGEIEAGRFSEVMVSLNTIGLVPDELYEASLVFHHDGIGGELIVPLMLHVTEEGGAAQRAIPLVMGWNLVSTNIFPEGADDFVGLMSQLTDEDLLILAKDPAGNFYWPAREFDNIRVWNELSGYWIKVSMRTQLLLGGESVPMDTPIELAQGWNTVSYLPRIPASAEVALSTLGDNLLIVRDGMGHFYLPAYNYSGMDVMREGFGYQVRVAEATELVYDFNGAVSRPARRYADADLDWIEGHAPTGSQHNLLLLSSLSAGTRIATFTPDGIPAGRGVVGSDGMAGITLWGDDPSTEARDGFSPGESPVIKVVATDEELGYAVKEGSTIWNTGGWGVATTEGAGLPLEFAISSAWPNPFNSSLHITFSLSEGGFTSLRIFDLAGREVATLVSGDHKAGVHSANWKAAGYSSGLYLLKLESAGRKATQKVMLIK